MVISDLIHLRLGASVGWGGGWGGVISNIATMFYVYVDPVPYSLQWNIAVNNGDSLVV